VSIPPTDPEGPLGAYRTYAQLAEPYRECLNGAGVPCHPAGNLRAQPGDRTRLATPEIRSIVDSIGPAFGWAELTSPKEWWHITYVGR
jgi:hypothetical protein